MADRGGRVTVRRPRRTVRQPMREAGSFDGRPCGIERRRPAAVRWWGHMWLRPLPTLRFGTTCPPPSGAAGRPCSNRTPNTRKTRACQSGFDNIQQSGGGRFTGVRESPHQRKGCHPSVGALETTHCRSEGGPCSHAGRSSFAAGRWQSFLGRCEALRSRFSFDASWANYMA